MESKTKSSKKQVVNFKPLERNVLIKATGSVSMYVITSAGTDVAFNKFEVAAISDGTTSVSVGDDVKLVSNVDLSRDNIVVIADNKQNMGDTYTAIQDELAVKMNGDDNNGNIVMIKDNNSKSKTKLISNDKDSMKTIVEYFHVDIMMIVGKYL